MGLPTTTLSKIAHVQNELKKFVVKMFAENFNVAR